MPTQTRPLFAADNLLDQHTTTASSEATDFEKEKAFDGFAFDAWKPSLVGNAWLNSLAPSEEIVDYFGIFAHDFAMSKARAQLAMRDAAGNEFPISSVSKVAIDSRPIFENFPKVVQNLCPSSEEFDVNWAKGAGVTITANTNDDPDGFRRADKVVYDGTGSAGQVHLIIDGEVPSRPTGKYVAGFWLRAITGTIPVKIGNNLSGGSLNVTATTTWQFFQTPAVAGDGSLIAKQFIANQVGDNSTFDRLLVAKAIMQRSPTITAISGYQRTIGIQRFDVGAKEYRLNFFSKHNDFTFSEEFDNAAWGATGVTVTANDQIDPNGGATAEKFVADVTGQPRVFRDPGLPSVRTIYTWSCYMGRPSGSAKQFGALSHFSGTPTNANSFVEVNLTTGAIIASGENLGGQGRLLARGIETAGFGMWRVWITIESLPGDANNIFKIHPTDGDGNINGTIGDEIRAWGGQLERVPALGEYQPTTTAAIDNAIGQVGVANFGEVLEADTGIATGNPFFPHAGINEFVSKVSQTGQPLGHSLMRNGVEFTVRFQTVDIAWVRANWKNLIVALQRKPIFFAWDPDNNPGETVWAWLDRGRPAPPTFISPLHHNVSLRLVGLVE